MEKQIKLIVGAVALAALAACSNTNSNNASYSADSANKATINKADSAAKATTSSTNDSLKDKKDSSRKAVKDIKEDASKFLVKSFESGMYEIEISRLAAKQGANADVKKLAMELGTTHQAMNDKMAKIALDANYKLPGGIDDAHVKEEADLAKLKGDDFDKKYMDIIESGHEKAVDDFKDAAKNLATGETKAFAAANLPMIQSHLNAAKKIKAALK